MRMVLESLWAPPPMVYHRPRHDRLKALAYELGNKTVLALQWENMGSIALRLEHVNGRIIGAVNGYHPDGIKRLIEALWPPS